MHDFATVGLQFYHLNACAGWKKEGEKMVDVYSEGFKKNGIY